MLRLRETAILYTHARDSAQSWVGGAVVRVCTVARQRAEAAAARPARPTWGGSAVPVAMEGWQRRSGWRVCGERPGRALALARRLVVFLQVCIKNVLLLGAEQGVRWTGVKASPRARSCVAVHADSHQVFVKTLSGRTIALDVEDGTLAGLQRLVSAREGIYPAEQRLTYAGRDLCDGARLLSEWGIPRNATVHLSVRLRGGMELEKLLLCAQGFHMVWRSVREWFRTCWNRCAKEENQCPVRPAGTLAGCCGRRRLLP